MAKQINSKLQKQVDQAKRREVDQHIKNSDKKETFLKTWEDHVKNRNEIANFSTIAGDKIYYVTPQNNEIFLPFSEYYGDHSENWIIAVDIKTNTEVYRKNTKTVDMVTWKLSSS